MSSSASSIFSFLTSRVADQTSILSPLTLPLPGANIRPVAAFLDHVTSTPVHEVYFPILRFGAIHAARVTIAWAGMTMGKDRKGVGRLGDLFGYLTLAWGGGTIVSLLLSAPPSWLASPTPWLVYPTIYFLLIPTGLSRYVVSTCPPLLLNTCTAFVDGITRGVTVASLPSAVTVSNVKSSWFTSALLSGIAVSSSGWLVTGLGLHEADWCLGMPSVLKGGLWDTLDLWSGTLAGLVYGSLMRSHSDLDTLSGILLRILPSDILAVGSTTHQGQLVTPGIGRAIVVLLIGSLLCARVLFTTSYTHRTTRKAKGNKEKKTASAVQKDMTEKSSSSERVDAAGKRELRAATPKKSPRRTRV